jgi:hypothetical protein
MRLANRSDRSPGSQPFADEAIVFDLAGFGLPGAEIAIFPGDRDDGLPAGFVVAILWR